jgi:HD-like signal output (HDOD) protein
MPQIEQADISINDLFKGDLRLASPPALYFELKKVLEDPNKSLDDAGNVIMNDPALTMRLLKLVNSAYFSFPSRISTVSKAISLVGSKELQNLVLATLIIDKFTAQPGGMMSMREFWAMSLRGALMAKELALTLHCKNNEVKESIFICGLLHEIGKLVFYCRIPELAQKIGLIIEQTGEAEVDVEQQVLGFNHYDAGAELARLWNLPTIIPETIAQHCHPDKSSTYSLIADLVRSVNLSSTMEISDRASDLHKWGITDEQLTMIIDKVNEQFDALFSIFYAGR